MTPDQKRVIIAAASGFVIGRSVERYRIAKKRRQRLERMNSRASADFWTTIDKYLSNPRDNRSVEEMVKDWQTNLEFHKIVKDNNL